MVLNNPNQYEVMELFFNEAFVKAQKKISNGKGMGLDGFPDHLLRSEPEDIEFLPLNRFNNKLLFRNHDYKSKEEFFDHLPELVKQLKDPLVRQRAKLMLKNHRGIYDFSIKFRDFCKSIFTGRSDIPNYLLNGKLVLLNKTKEKAPDVSKSRPIVVLSPIRKFIELLWLEYCSETLWSQIGRYQLGFRPGVAGTAIQSYR